MPETTIATITARESFGLSRAILPLRLKSRCPTAAWGWRWFRRGASTGSLRSAVELRDGDAGPVRRGPAR